MENKVKTSNQAFVQAINCGHLSSKSVDDNFAGNYMYMGSAGNKDFFKHVDTRAYYNKDYDQAIKQLVSMHQLNSSDPIGMIFTVESCKTVWEVTNWAKSLPGLIFGDKGVKIRTSII